LFSASLRGHTETAKLLIEKGADVNAKNNNGWTPLYAAAIGDHTETVKLLIDKGADVNVKDSSGKTILHGIISKKTVSKRHTETIKLLKKHGAVK
jgi:ankyrin repeat protein